MSDLRDVLSMLEDSGSERMRTLNGHHKYRLPDGSIFVTGGTASDHRSANNAVAFLRRALRKTHPQIAERGRNHQPKFKRYSSTLGDVIKLKGIALPGTVDPYAAIGGTAPELEFQVLPAEPEPIQPSIPTRQRRLPRKERQAKPQVAKTLTPDQLEEANRILHVEGDAAMNRYLSACREGLVYATPELALVRSTEPIVAPQNLVPITKIHDEEDEMSNVLERARQELLETNQRLEGYVTQIATLVRQQETDTTRQIKLEAYIVKHEELATEAAQLISDILPAVVPPKPIPVPVVNPKRIGSPGPHRPCPLSFGMRDLDREVIPKFLARGLTKFNVDDMMQAIAECNFSGPQPERKQITSWIFAGAKRKDSPFFKLKDEAGMFGLKAVMLPQAQSEVTHVM